MYKEKELVEWFGEIDGKLSKLWDELSKDKFLYQTGPYPADHGKNHILNVLNFLKGFLTSCDNPGLLSSQNKVAVIAAAMIHDIPMIHMRPTGASGKAADEARGGHADEDTLREMIEPLLIDVRFTAVERGAIVLIASCHANDRFKSLEWKMKKLEKEKDKFIGYNLEDMAVLLQVADFLDMGQDRLTGDVENQAWDDKQIEHYKKHLVARIVMDRDNRQIAISLQSVNTGGCWERRFKIPPMERYQIIYMIIEEAEKAIKNLNKISHLLKWNLVYDKNMLCKITPVGARVGLFRDAFEKAYKDWNSPDNDTPFPVWLMGHSLHGRFVKNQENLNPRLKKILGGAGLDLRILTLDPDVENQQMCEVYDGQCASTDEKGRAILPLYDKEGNLQSSSDGAKGDILSSFKELAAWIKDVGSASTMEVRSTTRLMYMSLTRYGNTLIVTPYRRMGLFNDSIALVFEKDDIIDPDSPFYDEYLKAFENIWSDPMETTLKFFKPQKDSDRNPVDSFLPPYPAGGQKNHPAFDYEVFFLDNNKDRIKAAFDQVREPGKHGIAPPVEVEIQPSASCPLFCTHCIGGHIGRGGRESMGSKEKNFDVLLGVENCGKHVERFRISGLVGDPLCGSSRESTLEFIRKAKENQKKTGKDRQIILLTNGVELKEAPELVLADYIHVSLDAATAEIFKELKRENLFDDIISNLRELRHQIDLKGSRTKWGIGFVITQINAHEVQKAVELANELDADFIRFKPDIRGMQAVHWRNLKEAVAKIRAEQVKGGKTDIIFTETGAHHHRVPSSGICWSQFFYGTVGPDNQLYLCDHQTTNPLAALGDCREFKEIWNKRAEDGDIGRKHPGCLLCPPLAWRLNRMIDQLYSLYKTQEESWPVVEDWINAALETRNCSAQGASILNG